MTFTKPHRIGLAASCLALAVGGLACGDDEDGDLTADDVEELGDSAGARAVAESIRVTLAAEDLEPGEIHRDVAVLEEAVGDLPGDPEVTGIVDDDGDGRDDDGKVEVRVDQEVACLSVAYDGQVDVTGGRC